MSQAPVPHQRRRASGDRRTTEQFLVVGQILAARGLRGELKVRAETDDPARFTRLTHVYLGEEKVRYAVAGARFLNDFVLLSLSGVRERNGAEALRGLTIYVDPEQALPLAEGEYYHHQIEGLSVLTEDGQTLGRVSEVLETGANDVYVVAGPAGELLLPAIKDVILHIDLVRKSMTVRVPEGLSD